MKRFLCLFLCLATLFAFSACGGGEDTEKLSENGNNVFTQGDLSTLSGEYTVEITVQLSTGERPVVYSGTIQL